MLEKNLKYLATLDGFPIANVDQSNLSLSNAKILADFASCTVDDLMNIDLEALRKLGDSPIRMLVMDVDGVLADGGMYFTESGDELKRFSSRDGLALKKIGASGVITGIISAGIAQKAIHHRAEMLDIDHVYVGASSKFEILQKWCVELGITLDKVAYVGDDLTDVEILKEVGLSACPANAAIAVKKLVKVVLRTDGGQGCIRELIEDYMLPSLKNPSV